MIKRALNWWSYLNIVVGCSALLIALPLLVGTEVTQIHWVCMAVMVGAVASHLLLLVLWEAFDRLLN